MIRHLPPIFVTGLLFGIVGMPVGAVVFLTLAGTADGRPFAMFGILKAPGLAGALTVFFGGIPAIATGIIAGILRRKFRSLPVFAIVMALSGAIATAIYVLVLIVTIISPGRWPDGAVLLCSMAFTGAVGALCCAVLQWKLFR
ncbi:MAG TPA: hypothetical protein VGQ35_08390 [Dongiaceae bacterium]|nr:hypothetical protein [Dongiaceae bacterium]